MSVKDELEVLARNLAKQANGKEVRLGDRVEALKALTGYYAMINKVKPQEEENANPVSFSQFRKRITE